MWNYCILGMVHGIAGDAVIGALALYFVTNINKGDLVQILGKYFWWLFVCINNLIKKCNAKLIGPCDVQWLTDDDLEFWVEKMLLNIRNFFYQCMGRFFIASRHFISSCLGPENSCSLHSLHVPFRILFCFLSWGKDSHGMIAGNAQWWCWTFSGLSPDLILW